MSFVLGMVFWVLGIRGHIPQFGDYHPVRAGSPVAINGGAVMGVLAAAAAALSVFALEIGRAHV